VKNRCCRHRRPTIRARGARPGRHIGSLPSFHFNLDGLASNSSGPDLKYNPTSSAGSVGVALLIRDSVRHELRCCYPTCQRLVLLFPDDAARRFGSRAVFPSIARRAMCSKCGARGRDGFITCGPYWEDVQARRQALWEAQRIAKLGET